MVGGGGGVSWEFTGLRKIRSDFTGLSPKSAAGEIFTDIFVYLRPAEAKISIEGQTEPSQSIISKNMY